VSQYLSRPPKTRSQLWERLHRHDAASASYNSGHAKGVKAQIGAYVDSRVAVPEQERKQLILDFAESAVTV
jgi:hypothetical protein